MGPPLGLLSQKAPSDASMPSLPLGRVCMRVRPALAGEAPASRCSHGRRGIRWRTQPRSCSSSQSAGASPPAGDELGARPKGCVAQERPKQRRSRQRCRMFAPLSLLYTSFGQAHRCGARRCRCQTQLPLCLRARSAHGSERPCHYQRKLCPTACGRSLRSIQGLRRPPAVPAKCVRGPRRRVDPGEPGLQPASQTSHEQSPGSLWQQYLDGVDENIHRILAHVP
mmetsp:Transcript_17539/g.42087  ORF Transcript_17539/g.42087 Transcript_17539/m.42087 type:complete len:225 (+) Transcript_17539:1203-1877(+)